MLRDESRHAVLSFFDDAVGPANQTIKPNAGRGLVLCAHVRCPSWLTFVVRLSRSHREISALRGIFARLWPQRAAHTSTPCGILRVWRHSIHSLGNEPCNSPAEPAGHCATARICRFRYSWVGFSPWQTGLFGEDVIARIQSRRRRGTRLGGSPRWDSLRPSRRRRRRGSRSTLRRRSGRRSGPAPRSRGTLEPRKSSPQNQSVQPTPTEPRVGLEV